MAAALVFAAYLPRAWQALVGAATIHRSHQTFIVGGGDSYCPPIHYTPNFIPPYIIKEMLAGRPKKVLVKKM